MSPSKSGTTARSIVDEVFGRGMTREIWSGNYEKVLPISVQDFELSAVLPAVFYMFRFGRRRGKGKFLDIFANTEGTLRQRRQSATIDRVAGILSAENEFEGFDDEAEKSILGDMLLCYCLENTRHSLGRRQQVQRVAPAHYMASWLDLPDLVVHLRYVPEMMVAMLADQTGETIQQSREGDNTWFTVGAGFEDNVLLKAFHQGVQQTGTVLDNRTSDHFQEDAAVGLDQLLMIRLAQQLGEAPDTLRGGGEQIINQRPIAELADRQFSEDIRNFVRAYSLVIPRHSFVDLLESCMAVGLTTIISSSFEMLFEWADTGYVTEKRNQNPTSLFVDCSNGVIRTLRTLAEQSMDDYVRRIERVPIILMAMRLLDHAASHDPKLRRLNIMNQPYATEWLNLLGDLLLERRKESIPILYMLDSQSSSLAEHLADDYPEQASMLNDDTAQPNPVWRLAEALTLLQGRSNTVQKALQMVDSALMTERPNGLAIRRRVRRVEAGGGSRTRDVRSLVFTDSVLDYLVHRHVLKNGKHGRMKIRRLSYKDFLRILRDRYGFCVDVAPPGMAISNEQLQANRAVLERRLRDLGLLIGVNDAEAMKCLRPRFEPDSESAG